MLAGRYETYADYVNQNKDLFPDVFDSLEEEEEDEYEEDEEE